MSLTAANPLYKDARFAGASGNVRSPEVRLKQAEEHAIELRSAVICALNQVLDLKDPSTGVHSTRLAELALGVAANLNLGVRDYRDIEIAAILHDIGKIGVPDAILSKPGALTPDERTQMEKHSEYGWAILRRITGFERSSLLVLHHHERIDGGGYPARLKGSEIPLGSRIVGVVDAFDAMVSDRGYRSGLPSDEAIKRLDAAAGSQFDPQIVKIFTRIVNTTGPESSHGVGPIFGVSRLI